jgi:hypothetical protein
MENFRRGLHSYLGAGAKTSLGVCLTELKHNNLFNKIDIFLGLVTKKLCSPILKLSMNRAWTTFVEDLNGSQVGGQTNKTEGMKTYSITDNKCLFNYSIFTWHQRG